ncbi:hypothetical protein GDO86_009127 [Hymenochirus boettgeri]|uniref:Terminal uridylyltransferase 4 n=1 Tax=Hymenochirus boettgeri TaxID=247094 RepID=A0A8T2JF91_9PIPI|nr:hypothetical protein GDO86_009127 [Hymenochirus boettgeri]
MEGVSKPVNNDAKKSMSHVIRVENKVVRVVSSQKHKFKGDSKVSKEVDGQSPNKGKKGKQTESSGRILADSKIIKENTAHCTTSLNELGFNDLDLTQSRAKKPSSMKQPQTVTAEKISSKSKENGQATGKQNLQPQGTLENGIEPKNENSHQELFVETAGSDQKLPDLVSAINKVIEISSPRENMETRVDSDDLTLADEELGLKQAEERLERDYIYRLEKRSPEYSNCQYLCKLCTVHIENVQGAHKHIKEKRHKKNILEKQEENELRGLPPPTLSQISALELAVMNTANEHGISQEDFLFRKNIVKLMESIILKKLPECSLRMYGSSQTRFAFKSSDINIDVKFPLKMSQPDVLIQVLDVLKNSDCFAEVESDFHAKIPVVYCKDRISGLTCKVSAGNDTACLTTEFLEAIGRLEPSLIPLVLAFRYWARLCHIDCQAEGGIPSYSFALMVVFFLQKRQLPILPAFLGPWIEGFESRKLDEYCLKGISDGRYLEWEYKPTCNSENKGSSAMDGRARKEHNNRRTLGFEAENKKNKERRGKSPLVFEYPHNVSLGQLWLELLKFYTLEFALEEHVISVRVKGLLTRDNKNWPRRRIAIEDPFTLKRNVARSLNSQMVYEYILERFRAAYRYFACPQGKERKKSKTDSRKRGKCNSENIEKPEDVANGNCLEAALHRTTEVDQNESNLTGKEVEKNGQLCPSQKDYVNSMQRLVVDSDKAGHPTTSFVNSELEMLPLNEIDYNVEHLVTEEKLDCKRKGSLSLKEMPDTTEDEFITGAVGCLDNCSNNCTLATSFNNEVLKDEGSLREHDLHKTQ